jgi:hypothetical protein
MADAGTPLVFPVGHYLGARYDSGPVPSHEIRIGWEIVSLPDGDDFDVWTLAHGQPPWPAGREWTTADLRAAATDVGVREPGEVSGGLLDSGALVEVEPAGDAMVAFAAAYRFEPLLIGLGNGPDERLDRIGIPGLLAAARVTPRVYELWQWAHLWPDLWAACEALAAASVELDQDVQDESDPHRVLAFALGAVQLLIAHGVGYLDAARVPREARGRNDSMPGQAGGGSSRPW